ncbi:PEP-CTERM sorting domain-containing protein [Echinimonas agarilytica]|uniref:PEP-CTERM sorting domain-containing protein n=1 Tax=Echinimonas agarilytica TaxID=1215918 RepID=A0AA41WBM8_9GAMM|nr:PEP-CTERM sorting domain-containing protein [Echinimonas agarilytica]MCM2681378.1 PEP-CTERM sorting domain-containing protein [Echinimonas agarilytica]
MIKTSIVAVACVLSGIAQASVLYDSADVAPNLFDIGTSDNVAIVPQQLAGQFNVAETIEMTTVSVFGAYADWSHFIPGIAGNTSVDNFNVSVLSGDNGDAVVSSNIATSVTRTLAATAADIGWFYDIYRYEFSVNSTVLEGGKDYWLAVSNTTPSLDIEWGWATSSNPTSSSLVSLDQGNSWRYNGGSLAFSIEGDVVSVDVPEPNVLVVFMLGLLALLAVTKRRIHD